MTTCLQVSSVNLVTVEVLESSLCYIVQLLVLIIQFFSLVPESLFLFSLTLTITIFQAVCRDAKVSSFTTCLLFKYTLYNEKINTPRRNAPVSTRQYLQIPCDGICKMITHSCPMHQKWGLHPPTGSLIRYPLNHLLPSGFRTWIVT